MLEKQNSSAFSSGFSLSPGLAMFLAGIGLDLDFGPIRLGFCSGFNFALALCREGLNQSFEVSRLTGKRSSRGWPRGQGNIRVLSFKK